MASSSSSSPGSVLMVTLPISFKPAFAGQKNIHMQALDLAGLPAGWQIKGTWTAQ